jgi:Mn2+/Fe2+ NRAMP family transporter
MGEYTNSKAFNAVAWATTIIMSILTLLLVATALVSGTGK